MENGYIKLHRKFLDWEWHEDCAMVSLWVHLLFLANYEKKRWRGIVIERGQFVTTLEKLSVLTGLSAQQIRTRLKKLIKNKCIEKKSTNEYTLITVCNYDTYQDAINEINKRTTNEQQTNNKRITHTKESKEINNNIDVVDITRTCEGNFLDSKINDWHNADIVSQNNIPDLTPQWIEDVRLLVRRFNQKELTADEVCSYYEDYKAQENNETLQDTYANWRRHFNNFIRKRIERQDNERDSKAAQDYNSPEARAKRQEGYARVMQKLIAEGQQPKKDDKLPF